MVQKENVEPCHKPTKLIIAEAEHTYLGTENPCWCRIFTTPKHFDPKFSFDWNSRFFWVYPDLILKITCKFPCWLYLVFMFCRVAIHVRTRFVGFWANLTQCNGGCECWCNKEQQATNPSIKQRTKCKGNFVIQIISIKARYDPNFHIY